MPGLIGVWPLNGEIMSISRGERLANGLHFEELV